MTIRMMIRHSTRSTHPGNNVGKKGLYMRFVIQRVSEASVTVEGQVIGQIGTGFLVLIGVTAGDDTATADKMVRKMLGLRIFQDAQGKTNLSLDSVGGSVLLVSQFTLYADCKKGNRPSFTGAGAPDMAETLYEYVIGRCCQVLGSERVAAGSFGADMKVRLLNDGPFTIVLDSGEL